MITETDLQPVGHDILRRLAHHWFAVRGTKLMPARGDIDPTKIPSVLPHIWLCDVPWQRWRIRCRLAGEAINDLFGRSLRNRYLDEILSREAAPLFFERAERVINGPAIAHSVGFVELTCGRTLPSESLFLPLAADEAGTSGLVGAMTCDLRDKSEGYFRGEILCSQSILALRAARPLGESKAPRLQFDDGKRAKP